MLSYENRPAMARSTPTTSDLLPLSPSASNLTNGSSLTNGHTTKSNQPETTHHHIWLITGPAGCGKSTVAQFIAKTMNLPYIEGDEYHPAANVDKMAKGIPLSDADRWDWLTNLREESIRKIQAGAQGVVLTCSALKRKYRDVIRVAPYYSHDVLVHFVYLHAPEEVLIARVGARKGHYMGANMVHSQCMILEPPGKEETDVITVDVSASIDEVEAEALAKMREAIKRELIRDS
ncbi:P-loop containing nucleoside triphosphate hydrolase protein [Hyaloscypha finlandica]|nr:P-loop containing nucleoside triphosphate hydrolase protein [Hyaloscypha finlandica]